MSRKKKPKKKVFKRQPVTSGAIVSTDNVEFAPASKRGSQYDQILEKMTKLEAGQTLKVPVPEGVTVAVLQNRLNSAIRRVKPEAPKGCEFVKKTTIDNQVAIICRKKKSAGLSSAKAA